MTDPVELRPEPIDFPGAAALVEAVQREYLRRYGGRDRTPVDPGEFAPPDGLFVVAYLGGAPVGCGGWRRIAGQVGEIKRMYVEPAARGRGLARALLAVLEAAATGAGCTEMRLETGNAQPEAIELYRSSGYERIPGYGYYRESPSNVCMAKPLRRAACA